VPRVGRNPLIGKTAPAQFPPVLAAVITHLPNEEGYHAERFEIIRRCLETMRAHANGTPVLVWDNGSNARLKEYLTNEYKPDYLMLCGNVGKKAAVAAILNMLPAQTLVALSDDDFEYAPGWLDASLELFNGFPNVGAVSAWAVRASFAWGNESTLTWAYTRAKIETGYFIPLDEVKDYYASVGGDADLDAGRYMQQRDVRITYNGLTAYATAQHAQFICQAGRLKRFATYSGEALGKEKEFDLALDAAGLLRLTTTKQYARHLGNRF
jgi:hypothetical protein